MGLWKLVPASAEWLQPTTLPKDRKEALRADSSVWTTRTVEVWHRRAFNSSTIAAGLKLKEQRLTHIRSTAGEHARLSLPCSWCVILTFKQGLCCAVHKHTFRRPNATLFLLVDFKLSLPYSKPQQHPCCAPLQLAQNMHTLQCCRALALPATHLAALRGV